MQSKQAFSLFIALVSLITFSFNLTAQIDTAQSAKDSIIFAIPSNSADSVDKLPSDSTKKADSTSNSEISEDAIESKIIYKARDTIKYNFTEQKVFLYGDAIVTYEDIELKAEYIELRMDSDIVYAVGVPDSNGNVVGSPVFKESGQEYRSQKMTYNFKTGKGKIDEVITQDGEGYVHGEDVKKTGDDVVYIQNGLYTTCEHDHPHFSIWAKQMKVIPNDKIIVKPANLIIEDVNTPALVPFGIFPNRSGGKSGVLVPMPGESARDGFYLINGGYYFYLSEKADLEIETDIYSKGSYAIRPSFNYRKRYKRSGHLKFRHKNTVNGVIPEDPDYEVLKDYWVEWMHKQDPKSRPNSNFSAAVNLGTQTAFRNDINTPDDDYLRSSFTSKISYSKDMLNNKLHFSLNARQTQNNQSGIMTLSLPEANISMNRIFPFKSKKTMKSRWYDNIGISYNGNIRNELNINTDSVVISSENFDTLQNSFRNGMQHNVPLSVNFKVFKHLTFTPSINYRELWYLERTQLYMDPNDTNHTVQEQTLEGFSRANSWRTSANFTTKLYGMLQFKKGKIKAFRHVMTPSVGLSYTPENVQGMTAYTDYSGSEAKQVEYSLYRNGIFGRPDTDESGKVNMSLLNNFEMKVRTKTDTGDGEKKIKLLENLKFGTGYDMVKDSLHWDNIAISGNSSISRYVNLVLGSQLDLYALKTDSTGNYYRSSDFDWNVNKRFARMTNGNIGLNFNLTGGKGKDKKKKKGQEDEDEYEDEFQEESYDDRSNSLRREYTEVDWDVPWNVRVQFNMQYNQKIDDDIIEDIITSNLQLNGDLSLTRNWKITYNMYVDPQEVQVTFANLGITRNLHCWQMTLNWTPIGDNRQSYTFNIGVRANVLQDLKYDKRSF